MEDSAVNSILNMKSGQVKKKYAAKPEDLQLHEDKVAKVVEKLLKALDLEHADKNEMNKIKGLIKAVNYPPEVYIALKKYYKNDKSCGYAPNCGNIDKCLFIQQLMWFVLQNGNSYPIIDPTYNTLPDDDKLSLQYGALSKLEILAKDCGGEEIEKLRAMKKDLELKNTDLESKLSQLLAENNTKIIELQAIISESSNETSKLKIELELCNKLNDTILSNKESELTVLKLELDAAKALSNSLSENNKELSERFSKETDDAAKRFDEASTQHLRFQTEARDASLIIEQKLRDTLLSEAVASAKISELQKTVDTLTKELSELKGQLDTTISIAGKYSVLESENTALLAKVSSGEDAVNKLNETQRDLISAHAKELEKIALEDAAKLEQAEKKVTDLYNKCLLDGKTNLDNVANELQKDKNALQNELSKTIEIKTTLATELADAKEAIKNSEGVVSELNNKILDHSTKTTALSVEISSLNKDLEAKTKEADTKEAEIVRITEQFVQSDGLAKSSQLEIKDLNKKISEQDLSFSKQSEELSAARAEITKLLGESSELKQSVSDLKASLVEKTSEFDLQAKLLAGATLRGEELDKNLTNALNVGAELTLKVNTLEPQLAETLAELNKCKETLSKTITDLEIKTTESASQAEQIKQHLASISELQKKSDVCDDSLSKVTTKFDDTLVQKNKLDEELSTLSAKSKQQELDQSILQKKSDVCDDSLSKVTAKFDDILGQKNKLDEELSVLSAKSKQQEADSVILQKKSDVCDDSLSKVTAKFDDTLVQKNKLDEDLGALRNKNDADNKTLEQKIKALDDCNVKDVKLSAEIVQFKEELEQKNLSATELERKFNILMKRIKSFQKAKLPEMKLKKHYTPSKLVKMSVVSLKLVARSMNIPSSGTKDALIKRILKHK